MRYFKYYSPEDQKYYIWVIREDGMERCLNKIKTDDFSEWHNPQVIGYETLLYYVERYSKIWTEITKEEVFLEVL